MKTKLTWYVTLGLWFLPMVRMQNFGRWAWSYYAETGSIDAGNDLNHATEIGLAYAPGVMSMLLLCWLLDRRPNIVSWMAWIIACVCLGRRIYAAPERPIIFLPLFSPLQFGLKLGVLGIFGLAAHFNERLSLRINPTLQNLV